MMGRRMKERAGGTAVEVELALLHEK